MIANLHNSIHDGWGELSWLCYTNVDSVNCSGLGRYHVVDNILVDVRVRKTGALGDCVFEWVAAGFDV